MSNIRETCHCGHDKSSHFRDPGARDYGACLCRGCTCERYVYEGDPKPTKSDLHFHVRVTKAIRPHADMSCMCKSCREYEDWYRRTYR